MGSTWAQVDFNFGSTWAQETFLGKVPGLHVVEGTTLPKSPISRQKQLQRNAPTRKSSEIPSLTLSTCTELLQLAWPGEVRAPKKSNSATLEYFSLGRLLAPTGAKLKPTLLKLRPFWAKLQPRWAHVRKVPRSVQHRFYQLVKVKQCPALRA